jgi:sulfoacetaldehyde dehydrogenase
MVVAGQNPPSGATAEIRKTVSVLIDRAHAAQRIYERYSQEQVDEVVTAAGWAIVNPEHNRQLAELAVADTDLGNVADKITKNRRKTMGLLRDLQGAKSVGVIAEYPDKGITEIARPVGVVAAITPSTNPVATAANMIINALKGRNAVILSPSPKGYSSGARLLQFVHAELARVKAPPDLVQMLPHPVNKESTAELMRQSDLVVATGSQSNVRAAYASGTPAIGVGVGNVAVIVDDTAELVQAAAKIAASKTFDHATSCSSENSLVILDAVYDAMLAALEHQGGVLLSGTEKSQLQKAMWPDGRLSPQVTARAASMLSQVAGLKCAELQSCRFLMVEESGIGRDYPFSGEKLAPVLTLYRAHDFGHACALSRAILDFQGAGHSIGIHSLNSDHVLRLGLEMPVCRVIVNQGHAFATGGNFDNGLPFSLSMGCGTWGRNTISDNLNYRHYLNITRIARTIPPLEPSEQDLFGRYRAKFNL